MICIIMLRWEFRPRVNIHTHTPETTPEKPREPQTYPRHPRWFGPPVGKLVADGAVRAECNTARADATQQKACSSEGGEG